MAGLRECRARRPWLQAPGADAMPRGTRRPHPGRRAGVRMAAVGDHPPSRRSGAWTATRRAGMRWPMCRAAPARN